MRILRVMIVQLSTGTTANLPLTPHEIKWESHCDFKNDEELYFKALEENDTQGAIGALSQALTHIYGAWILDLPFSLDEPTDELFLNHYTVSLGDDLSLMRLYAHHNTIINTFKPDDLAMKVLKIVAGGEEYQLDQLKAAKFLTLEGLSTGEAIELLEFRRIAEKNLEDKKFGIGNMDFTLGLRELSILMRKKGEALPWKRKDLDNFINSRVQIFRGVTAAEVLTLRFFLINSYLLWLQNQTTNSSGTARPIKVQELRRKKPGIVKRRRGKLSS